MPWSKQSLFVRVSIFATEAHMHRAARHVTTPPFSALFIFTPPAKPGCHRDRMVGDAFFHTGMLDEGVVSHELLHAALEWVSRMKFVVLPDPRGYRTLGLSRTSEERLCTAHERMMNQFFIRARRLGLIGAR